MAGTQTESDTWQRGKTLVQSLQYARRHKILCDVVFNVGETETPIEAHKLVLSVRSRVFEAMLTGLMAEQGNIVIPDVDPDIFEQFLTFLYTDVVSVNATNAIPLLYCCKKYDVSQLEEKCRTYLETSVTPDSAAALLEQAHIYDEPALREKALACIRANGEQCLKSRGMGDLCQSCLSDVIKLDDLTASEQTVFECILSWSESACSRRGKEVTPQNRRHVLGDAVLHVRFPLFSAAYFVESVSPTELLTEAEQLKILKCIATPKSDVSPFNSKPRKTSSATVNRKQITVTRLDSLHPILGSWPCSGDTDDAIMFSVNLDASLAGFQLYGPINNTPSTYTINAFVTKVSTDELVEGSQISRTVTTDKTTYDVLFDSELQLVRGERYNLIVCMRGPGTRQGWQGRQRVDVGELSCSFFNYKKSRHSDKESKGTSVNAGQIPSLMFVI